MTGSIDKRMYDENRPRGMFMERVGTWESDRVLMSWICMRIAEQKEAGGASQVT